MFLHVPSQEVCLGEWLPPPPPSCQWGLALTLHPAVFPSNSVLYSNVTLSLAGVQSPQGTHAIPRCYEWRLHACQKCCVHKPANLLGKGPEKSSEGVCTCISKTCILASVHADNRQLLHTVVRGVPLGTNFFFFFFPSATVQ